MPKCARVSSSSGKAMGVELTTGERFVAKDGVIGAIDPKVLANSSTAFRTE